MAAVYSETPFSVCIIEISINAMVQEQTAERAEKDCDKPSIADSSMSSMERIRSYRIRRKNSEKTDEPELW